MSLEPGSVVASGDKDAIQKRGNLGIVLSLMLKQELQFNKVQESALTSFGHQQLPRRI